MNLDEFEDIQDIIQFFIFFLKILFDVIAAQIQHWWQINFTILARPKFSLGFGGISFPFNEVIKREVLDIFFDKNLKFLSYHE